MMIRSITEVKQPSNPGAPVQPKVRKMGASSISFGMSLALYFLNNMWGQLSIASLETSTWAKFFPEVVALLSL